MDTQERLDRHTGSLVALETALVLLVQHMELRTGLDRQAFIADLQQLSERPEKDADVLRAEQRILRLLRALSHSR